MRRIAKHYVSLASAVDRVIEFSEPVRSCSEGEPLEYVIPAEDFHKMFGCLLVLKENALKNQTTFLFPDCLG